ncbi:MurR/RpiR family transcriptional regulator, partial [Commensalibacter sp. Nvir]|uniref:MurR/RpiR family transcriptional regulator n=1 Tax=Commensalibacter sp. Nvir TaxID=3069817 RepID=UPI0030C818E7
MKKNVKSFEKDQNTTLAKNFYELHHLILEKKQKLPKRLIQIADFLVTTPSYTIAFGKITKLAEAASVPPSALVRFAKTMGYSGFSELQSVFRDHASRFWPDYSERLQTLEQQSSCDNVENPKILLSGFAEASRQSLTILEQNINYSQLEDMINFLAKADNICLVGAERVYSIIIYMVYIFRRSGIKCDYANDAGGFARNQIELLDKKKDAILTISYAPYASKTLELVFHAAGLGIPIAVITDASSSPFV